MWSSPPEILLSEDEINLILRSGDNTVSLAEFPLQDKLIKVSLQLTGSCGLVMAQVISVETNMNIFFDLKLSISSIRADRGGRQNERSCRMKHWKDFFVFFSFRLLGDERQAYLRMPTWPRQSALAWCFLRCCTPPRRTPSGARKALLESVTTNKDCATTLQVWGFELHWTN